MSIAKGSGAALLAAALALGLTAACNKQDQTSGGGEAAQGNAPGGQMAGGPPAGSGQAVFQQNCSRCHAINGQGGRRGPDLSHVGAQSDHTAQWLTEFIRDPKSKDAGSRMPAFGNRIGDADMQSLTSYLVTLK